MCRSQQRKEEPLNLLTVCASDSELRYPSQVDWALRFPDKALEARYAAHFNARETRSLDVQVSVRASFRVCGAK